MMALFAIAWMTKQEKQGHQNIFEFGLLGGSSSWLAKSDTWNYEMESL